MAKEVYTGSLGTLRTECGEYTVGDITKTYAIPTTLTKVVYATGTCMGGVADATLGAKIVTAYSICKSGGSFLLDMSIMDCSAGYAATSLSYFAVGW